MTKILNPEILSRLLRQHTGKGITDLFNATAILEWGIPRAAAENIQDFLEEEEEEIAGGLGIKKRREYFVPNNDAFNYIAYRVRQSLGCDLTESMRHRLMSNFMRRMSAMHHAAMQPVFR